MATFKQRVIFASLPKTERGRPIVLGSQYKAHGQKDMSDNFLYGNGTTLYLRSIKNPMLTETYTQHAKDVTVANCAKTGFYIASGDASGKVRIWDPTHESQILKNEYHIIAGAIKDIAWDSESKRVAIVGEGKEMYGKCITYDSGNSAGDFSRGIKPMNSVAVRPKRPFKAVTGSEDFKLGFYAGPPFKLVKEMDAHKNFVQCVRYSPDGEVFITADSNGIAIVWNGVSGDPIGCLGSKDAGIEEPTKCHKGGIYGLEISENSQEVLTVSADKTAKIWNVQSRELVQEFVLGSQLEDMQVGCLWKGDNLLSVSLSGFINYLDRSDPSKPKYVIKGHNKPIMSMAVTEDRKTIYTGASDGQIMYWNASTGDCERIKGKGHSNQVSDMTMVSDLLISVAMDDTIRFTNTVANEYSGDSIPLPSQPLAVAVSPSGLVAVACIKHVVLQQSDKKRSGEQKFSQEVKYEPCSVAIHPGNTIVAVGGAKDNKIHIYDYDGDMLKERCQVVPGKDNEVAEDMKFSPDGAFLAIAGRDKNVTLYSISDFKNNVFTSKTHTARVKSIAWAPNSQHFATTGLDMSIVVWSAAKLKFGHKAAHIQGDHRKLGIMNRVEWLDNTVIVSAGADSCVRQFEVSLG